MVLFRLGVMAYWLVPLLIFCLIFAGGTFLAFKFNLFTDEFSAAEQPPDFINASGEIIIPKLLESYLSAVGGREALLGIQSLRYKGYLREPSGDVAFQILISLPDKGMIITELGRGARHRLVLNGPSAWQAIDYGDGTKKIVPLDEANTASLIWSLRVHNSFRQLALEGSGRGMSARKVEYLGKPAYAITQTMPDQSVFEAVLDAKTLYLLWSEENVPGVAGSPERVEVRYEDHRIESGVVEAFRASTYKKGVPFNETIIESIELNPGLMSSLFEVPQELLK